MARNVEHQDPRTPRQRQSLGILGSFRNFTGNRRTAQSPEGVTQSAPVDFLPGSSGELLQLRSQLNPENSVKDRIQAANTIAERLAEYPVEDIVDIWNDARPLIKDEKRPDIIEAGYRLFLACVQYKTLTPYERRFFFGDINSSTTEHFAHRLQILIEITDHGKYIESLEFSVMPLVIILMRQAYESRSAPKSGNGSTQGVQNPKTSKSSKNSYMRSVLRFVIEVIKFNSKILQESDLQSLVKQVLWLCKNTSEFTDVGLSLEVLDAVVVYSSLPESTLRETMEVLCSVIPQPQDLRDKAWAIIFKLTRSHLGPQAINTLLTILRENCGRGERIDRNIVRGAVHVLRAVRQWTKEDETIVIDVGPLLKALKSSLKLNSASTELSVLQLLNELMQDFIQDEPFLNEEEWTSFLDTLLDCSQRGDDPKELEDFFLGQEAHTSTSKSNAHRKTNTFLIQTVANRLTTLAPDLSSSTRRLIMSKILRLKERLDDTTATYIIQFYSDEHLLSPMYEGWLTNCDQLYHGIFKNKSRSPDVRILAFNEIRDAFMTAEAMNAERIDSFAMKLVENIPDEDNMSVLDKICSAATEIATRTTDRGLFTHILNCFRASLDSLHKKPGSNTILNPVNAPSDSPRITLAKYIVRMFLRNIEKSAWKSQEIYAVLLHIAGTNSVPADARIIAMKALFRLRSDYNSGIFVISSPRCESLAAALLRTADSLENQTPSVESPLIRPVRSEDHYARRRTQNAHSGSSQLQSSSQSTGRPATVSNRFTRPTPPLWIYPGPKGLPEDPPYAASQFVFSNLEDTQDLANVDGATDEKAELQLPLWLEIVLRILQQDELDWEIYSYLLVHLGAQLKNHSLFVNAIPQVKLLRSVLCNQLQNKTFHEPPSFTNLKRSDAAICLYQILTMVVSYHNHFGKSEQDEMIKVLVQGIGSWERTSESCIHALAVCCHELPGSVSKSLDNALQRMTQVITQKHLAVHVLEFLSCLARLPDLFKNFREEEFRMVFGICFRYLQYARSEREKGQSHNTARNTKAAPTTGRSSHDSLAVMEAQPIPKTVADELPQYIYFLTYHVMIFWFMSLKMLDRPRQMSWIIKNLLFTNESGVEVLEEQSQVSIDLMQRIAYSDRDETHADSEFAKPSDGMVSSKSWLVGLGIVTVETAGRTGLSQITFRRPSGTKFSVMRPLVVPQPRHQVPIIRGLAAETFYTESYTGVLPDDIIQELYAPLNFSSALSFAELPVPLPDDDATRRAIGAFDRISPLDSHKIGIIFIGEGQTDEATILANKTGSADYLSFLENIGTLTELKGAKFNTQGLDREFDSDGKFTICWRDRVSEVVFHVTTMMPTNLEHDPNCANKKKHTGNDFVNIIFNNSGLPFDFNTFPSDFNFVNIVISPEARPSFIENRLQRVSSNQADAKAESGNVKEETAREQYEPEKGPFYRIKLKTKPGIPSFSTASEAKIVSGRSLPAFVRLLALNASVFSSVWANRHIGEHVSSWRTRLREIMRLRERHCAPGTSSTANVSNIAAAERPMVTSPPNSSSSVAASSNTAEAPAGRGQSGGLLRRSSAVLFGGSGGPTSAEVSEMRRSVGIFGSATDMERTTSASSTGSK